MEGGGKKERKKLINPVSACVCREKRERERGGGGGRE